MFAQMQYQYMKQWHYISERSHTCLSNLVLGIKHKFVKLLRFASLWLGRKINNAFVYIQEIVINLILFTSSLILNEKYFNESF